MAGFSLQFRETISELCESNGLMGLLMQRDHTPHTGLAMLQSIFFFVKESQDKRIRVCGTC